MDRLGLGYDAISRANPQIVYAKISSQGASGPEMDYGSLGSTLEQTAGLASITGYEGGQPLMSNETFPDPVVGILTVGALMAALRVRLRTGKGAFIDLSQREVTVGMMGEAYLDYAMNGRVAGLAGNRHHVHAPQGVYPCVGDDSWVAVSVRSDSEWRGTVRGHPPPGPGRRRAAGDGRGPARTPRRNRRGNSRVDTRARPLPGHAPAPGSRRAGGRGAQGRGDHRRPAPGGERVLGYGGPPGGRRVQAGDHALADVEERRVHATPAPGLGEHNALVLGDLLGLPDSELEALESRGIIGTRPVGAD